MLLDEPTQGMGHEDVSHVTRLIKQVSANRTVLMVEHNMSVVASIADTISVLQRGRVIAAGPYAEVSKNPQVIEAYMGASSDELSGPADGREMLKVAGSAGVVWRIAHPAWRRILSVQEGEVVTLLGRNGAGRTTTLRAIMGLVGVAQGFGA